MTGVETMTQLGRYRIERELGRGGMSVVYRGLDPALGRTVAVKVLHPHLAARAEARERFAREARAVARLDHPNIVAVYDYAPPESERSYLVTEFIDGPNLRAALEGGPLKHPEVAALLMAPVFDALDHAHSLGIVHRDVKPENIMLRPDGQPVLVDFGIAQLIDMDTLTQTGTMLGSPAHMAPEIIDGADSDGRADLFSAATVLYWLACGALPFTASSPAALFRRILECRFEPVLQRTPAAGRGLARLIEQCLERDPAKRPQRASEVAGRLRSLLAEVGLTDGAAELARWSADRVAYEAVLGVRLIPPLLVAARAAIESKKHARAADLLDRVLAIDERHTEAQALLGRLERRDQQQRLLRGVVWGAATAAVIAGSVWAIGALSRPSSTANEDAPPAAAELAPAPIQATEATAPTEPPAARRPAIGSSASVSSTSPLTARTAASAPPRPRPPASTPRPPPSARPAREVLVPFRADLWNAEVLVNGERRGYLYEVRGAGGLRIPAAVHDIEFKHPACATDVRRIDLSAAPDVAPPILFRCAPLPARLRVVSGRNLPVRNASTGELLGQTNVDLSVPMPALRLELALTIGELGGSLESLTVRLAAGTTTTETLRF